MTLTLGAVYAPIALMGGITYHCLKSLRSHWLVLFLYPVLLH